MDPKYIVHCKELGYYFRNSLNSWIYFTTDFTTSPKMDAFNSSDGKRDDRIKNSLPVGPLEKTTAYLFSYEP